MTIDNDTGRAVATLTLAQVMETYMHDRELNMEHLAVLEAAVKESHAAFTKALRKQDYDAMLGAATRLESYSDKLKNFTQKLVTSR